MLWQPPFGVTTGQRDGYGTKARRYRDHLPTPAYPHANDGAALAEPSPGQDGKPVDAGSDRVNRIAIIFGSPLSTATRAGARARSTAGCSENDWLDAPS